MDFITWPFFFFSFSLQNLLIQDSEGYRKQYEESIQEKVGCRNDDYD